MMDQQPVLAIAGDMFHDMIGTRYQQDVVLAELFTQVSVFSERVIVLSDRIREVV